MALSPAGKSSPSSLKDPKPSASTPPTTGTEPKPSPPHPLPYYRASVWPLFRQWLQRRKHPILVGPWKSEVGFEANYWLPFLTHLRETCGISRDRLIPITRGGAGVWYDTTTSLELYAMRTPQDVRVENRLQTKLRGQVKQTHVTPWDRAVLADAAKTLGLKHYDVLHPAWMYQLFMPVWEGQRGFGWMWKHWRMKILQAPPLPEGLVLPEKFIAARWYFRSTWPRTEMTVAFATEVLKLASAQLPVVLVHSGAHLDDHFDFIPSLPNVLNLRDLYPGMTPENNLAVQSAVFGRAEGFVGTYGGLGQLALTMGKSVVMFYDQWGGTSIVHKHLSDTIALQTGRSFNVLKVGDLPLLQSLLPRVLRNV